MEMLHGILGEQLAAVETSMLIEDGLNIEERLGNGAEAQEEAETRAAQRNALLTQVQSVVSVMREADVRLFGQATLLMQQKGGTENADARKCAKAVLESCPVVLEKLMGMLFENLLSEQFDPQLLQGINGLQRQFYSGATNFLQGVFAGQPSSLRTQLLRLYAGTAGQFSVSGAQTSSLPAAAARFSSLVGSSPRSHLQGLTNGAQSFKAMADQSSQSLAAIQDGLQEGAILEAAAGAGAIGRSIPGRVGERIKEITTKVKDVAQKVQRGIANAKKVMSITKDALLAAKNGGAKAGVQVVMKSIQKLGIGAAKGVGKVGAKVGVKAGLKAAMTSAKIGAKAGLAGVKSTLVAVKVGAATIAKAIATGSIKAVALAVKTSILAASASAGPVGWIVTAATAVVILVQGLVKLFKRLAKRIRLKRAARVEAREGARQREAIFGVERDLSRREERDIKRNDRHEARQERKKERKEAKKERQGYQRRQARKEGRKEKKEAKMERKKEKMESASPQRQERFAKKQERKERKQGKGERKEEKKEQRQRNVAQKARDRVLKAESEHRDRMLREGKITQEQYAAWEAMQKSAAAAYEELRAGKITKEQYDTWAAMQKEEAAKRHLPPRISPMFPLQYAVPRLSADAVPATVDENRLPDWQSLLVSQKSG